MNGVSPELFVADCALGKCHWISEPLPTPLAAQEQRRKHLSSHQQAELVDHICSISTEVARYVRPVEAR